MPADSPSTRPPPPPPRKRKPTPDRADVGNAAPPRARDRHSPTPDDRQVVGANELIDICEAELASEPEKVRKARLHYEIARASEGIDELSRAREHYGAALELVPHHLPSVRGARRLALRERDHAAAVALFDSEIATTNDPRRKAALWYAKGRVLEDIAKNADQARACYTTAASLDRNSALVMRALARCEQRSQAWGALSKALERVANCVRADPRHRAALVVERARVQDVRLNDGGAAAGLYESALELDADSPAARSELRRLLHAQARWHDLISVLEGEVDSGAEAHAGEAAADAADAWISIAEIESERLGDRDRAIAALEKVAGAAAPDANVIEELVRLYAESDDAEKLIGMLEQQLDRLQRPLERLGILHQMGRLYEERLDDDGLAAHWYGRALEIDPTYVPALSALAKLHASQGSWDALASMYLAEADAIKDNNARRADAHARAAEILEGHLERPEQAIEHHARALALAPGLASSFKALGRLLAHAGKRKELIALHEQALDWTDEAPVLVAHLFKIGALHEELDDHERAARAYRRILEHQPNNMGAIHAVQQATESAGLGEELVEALEMEVERSRDPSRVLALLHRAGEALLRLDRRDAALARFRKALELDRTYAPALVSLARIYHQTGRWPELLDIFTRQLEASPARTEKIALLYKMGELCERRIGDDEAALGHYRAALELDASHSVARHAVLRLLRQRGDWGGAVEVLEAELESQSDPAAKADMAARIGEIHETRLDRSREAARFYHMALEQVVGHRRAGDGLARVSAELGAWDALADELMRRASRSQSPAEALDALVQSAAIYAERLDQPKRALVAYEMALEKQPSSIGVMLALESLYAEAGKWDELAHLYVKQAKAFADPEAQVAALTELSRVFAVHGVGEDSDLRNAYTAILSRKPDDLNALTGLETLALTDSDRELLMDVDRRFAAAEQDDGVIAAHHVRLARALEDDDPARAIEAYRQAVTHDGDDLAAIRGLARVADQQGDAQALAESERRLARWSEDGKIAADRLVRSAVIASADLNDAQQAVTDLEQALERWPDHAEAADRLDELLLDANMVDRLIGQLTEAARSATTADRKVALWRRVGQLQANRKDDLQAGILALSRALRSDPADVSTLLVLVDLHAREQRWVDAAGALDRVVRLGPRRDILTQALRRLATIASEHLGDQTRAIASLQALLRLEPRDREAIGMLLDAHARDGDTKSADRFARRLLRAASDPGDRAFALFHAGRIGLLTGDRSKAAEAWRAAVALEGASGEAAEHFRKLMSNGESWQPYADALDEHLKRVAKREVTVDDPAPTILELARVQHDRLDAADRAFATLRQGLEVCGQHPGLRLDLGERLARHGHHDQAVVELQQLLAAEPTSVVGWRALGRALREGGHAAEADAAMAPLVVLGAASQAELELARRHVGAGAARPAGFGGPALANLVPGPDASVIVALLQTMADALGKMYASDIKGLGLASRQRLSERSHPTLHELCARLAVVFGVDTYQAYCDASLGPVVTVALSSTPTILIPEALDSQSKAAQVFALARVLAEVAMGVHTAVRLGRDDLALVLAAAGRTVTPGHDIGDVDSDALEDGIERLQKSLGRRGRKTMAQAAAPYVAAPRVDLDGWLAGIERTTVRAAAMLAGDLTATVELLAAGDRTTASLSGPALLEASTVVDDLVRFWASAEAFAFRRSAGIL